MEKKDWNIIKTVIDRVLEHPEETQIKQLEDSVVRYPDLKEEIFAHYKSIKDSNEFWENAFEVNQQMVTDSIDIEHLRGVSFIEYKKGSRIGAYVLDEQIGKGGMGIVFKATRADGQFERTVAIKLMALNIQFDEIQTRFLREQQILASLNHVNIGQLFDAGVTAIGNPYLVMEYVEGKEVTDYIKSDDLTLNQILILFLEVCKAVEYAHRNLIIHRDLKPSNILVTKEGRLKVLDFGIAKLIGESMDEVDSVVTQNQQRLYSLSYASPEQIKAGVISTSSDIYTLGLLLFEMLTNERPFKLDTLSRSEAEKVLVDSLPPSITKKKPSLSKESDLSAIVSKCLRKEPEARYRSVSDLMNDIINYQESKPVLAHKGSGIYKARKFWNRNRLSVSFSGIFFISAILFSVFYTVRINKERLIAQQESEKAQLVTDYLINLFQQADPLGTEGRDQTIADFIKKSVDNLSELEDQPGLHQAAAFTLGRVNSNLGRYQDGEILLQKSLALAQQNNQKPEEIATIYYYLGELGRSKDRFGEALKNYNSAKRILQKEQKADVELAIQIDRGIAVSNAHLGNIEEAESLLSEVLEQLDFDPKKVSQETVLTLSTLADISREKDNYESSVQLEEQVIYFLENQLVDNDLLLMSAYNNLGISYRYLGEYEKALINYNKTLDLAEKMLGLSHPKTLTTLNNMAGVYNNLNEYAQALEIRNEQLARTITEYGEIHWRSASAYGSVAEAEMELQLLQALETIDKSVEIFNQVLGPEHFWTLRQQLRKSFIQFKLGSETKAFALAVFSVDQLINTVNGPLAYYDKSGLEVLQKAFKDKGFEFGYQELSRFFSWYSSNIES